MLNGRVRVLALAAADAAVLLALRPDPGLLSHLAAPRAWLASAGADGAAAQLAAAGLWLAALWLAVGLLAAVAAALPGACGRAAAGLAGIVLPRVVRQLLAGATGMGVLLAPVVASAAAPTHDAAATPTAATPTAPAWPSDAPVPAPAWPSTATAPAHRQPAGQRRLPRRADAPQAGPVTVGPGDSLWSIAAAHLDGRVTPQRVAVAWPRWYAANRALIGTDPDHIVAGQLLRPPHRTHGKEAGS